MGVFAAYASRHGYALVDKRLFMPETVVWRGLCGATAQVSRCPRRSRFTPSRSWPPRWSQAIRGEGRLPFKYLVADCLYGNSPDFLDAIDACVGVTSLVSDSRRYAVLAPAPADHGENLYVQRSSAFANAWSPPQVAGAAARWRPWRRACRPRAGIAVAVSEGTKGPIEYEFARKRVTLCKDGLPERTVWLVHQAHARGKPDVCVITSAMPLRARRCAFSCG